MKQKTGSALTFLLVMACPAATAHAAAPYRIDRAAATYDRSATVDVAAARAGAVDTSTAQKVRTGGSLEGAIGWFDYDFSVPATGWYEVTVGGNAVSLEVLIDPRGKDPSQAAAYVPGSLGFNGKDDKIGNFFLSAGKHTVRLQRWYWTGFPRITGLTIAASDGRLGTRVSVTRPSAYGVFRKGECGSLTIAYGPQAAPSVLPIQFVDLATNNPIRPFQVALRASAKRETLDWPVPCDDEGAFVVYFHDPRFGIEQRDVHQFVYEVTNVKSPPAPAPLRKILVQEIDAVSTAPDYAAGDTRVSGGGTPAYRESGDRGWLDSQRAGIKLFEPSWFAYTLKGLRPQQAYSVEVDYPDDMPRTFAIALRESNPLSYPVAGGVDSGGEFPNSGRKQVHTLVFWPRAQDPRIVFLPARNGKRAAASAIRVYRLEGGLPPLVPPAQGNRQFVNWYEEGSNVLSMYGAPAENPAGARLAFQRWADAVAYMGVDTLWPAVVIYNFALYPSVFNVHFAQPWTSDQFRQLLMVAEQRRLKVIAEVHPRADELTWTNTPEPGLRPQLLVSKDGQNHKDLPPFYNPLHPKNQEWYLGMIGELVTRYRDSPALQGVSLRFMQWKNPTFHNFSSLEWGYDDLTVELFQKDTGARVPGTPGDATRFRERHRYLTGPARDQWISWRCRKMTELFVRIRDRVRQARPDLTVFVPVFSTNVATDMHYTGSQWLREAGIDAQALAKIPGVAVVNAMHIYGRRSASSLNQLLRTHITNPTEVRSLMSPGALPMFLPTAAYFEATEVVAPPEQLGFPSNTKKTWMSAVVNPAGRNYLERFALLLAETDAALLGDGGNGYTLGQAELREFLSEYRHLPAAPFTRRSDSKASVAVWELRAQDRVTFYAVNRTPNPAGVTISLDGNGTVSRLSSGMPAERALGTLALTLKPFELASFSAPASVRINRVSDQQP